MAKKSVTLLENQADLPGSESDPDMGAAADVPDDLSRLQVVEPVIQYVDPYVSDEDAVLVMTDVMGGSGDARFRSKRILARFASEGWRIVKGN